jgi:hypothetical protein
VNPGIPPAVSLQRTNQAGQLQNATHPKKRTFAVGNGNIDVGNKPHKAGQRCGVMSEQRSDSGHVGASPQKLLHLVGCRDPKMRPRPAVQPAPVKR